MPAPAKLTAAEKRKATLAKAQKELEENIAFQNESNLRWVQKRLVAAKKNAIQAELETHMQTRQIALSSGMSVLGCGVTRFLGALDIGAGVKAGTDGEFVAECTFELYTAKMRDNRGTSKASAPELSQNRALWTDRIYERAWAFAEPGLLRPMAKKSNFNCNKCTD
ncbi:hypothetical protein B0H14DRAFT_2571901 [Mycena olivaceomarginata]|nr:hypothetical protein B0H14DRAFT_2571901 [Mycena olivaceomarginata]